MVIGAGSAGCVLAARLSESAGQRVLLLEAGGEDSSPWIHVPVGYAKLMGDARYNWLYRTAPELALKPPEASTPHLPLRSSSAAVPLSEATLGNVIV